MKVTSWLMSEARRTAIYNIRSAIYGTCLRLCEAGGGEFCEMLGGGVPPEHVLKNPSYQRHMPTQLILWEYDPRALKCFAINRNYLMLLPMRFSYFVYFRSGRILFSM